MARLFDDAASEYAEVTSAVLNAVPISMACWARTNDVTIQQYVMSISRNNSTAGDRFALVIAGQAAGDPIRALCFQNASGSQADSASGISVNTWTHLGAEFGGNSSRFALKNGVKGTENTTARTPSTSLNNTNISSYNQNGTRTLYMSGDIAEAGIWNVALDAAEWAALAAGVCPLLIRPSALVAYWPFIGMFSPEIERMNRLELTLSGTVQSAHPAIYYRKRSSRLIFVPGASTFTASAAVTIGAVTCSGSATFVKPTYTGSGVCTIGATTCSGSGTFTKPTYAGTGTCTIGATTASGSATFVKPTYTGTVGATIAPVTCSGSATFVKPTYAGTGVCTIGGTTASGSGTFVKPTYTAAAAVTIGHTTASGSGIFANAVYQASAAVSIAPATVSGTGTFVKPTYAGTAALVIAPVTASGSATFVKPTYTATAAVTIGHTTCSGSAVFASAVYLAAAAVTIAHVTATGLATFEPSEFVGQFPNSATLQGLGIQSTSFVGVGLKSSTFGPRS